MSLDVMLIDEVKKHKCFCDRCDNEHYNEYGEKIYSRNITHNLTEMAGRAGIYYALWRPEEKGITKAKDLIEPLEKGLEALKQNPEYFKQFNPENGWGNYDGLVDFVEEYLNAAIENPEANIETCR